MAGHGHKLALQFVEFLLPGEGRLKFSGLGLETGRRLLHEGLEDVTVCNQLPFRRLSFRDIMRNVEHAGLATHVDPFARNHHVPQFTVLSAVLRFVTFDNTVLLEQFHKIDPLFRLCPNAKLHSRVSNGFFAAVTHAIQPSFVDIVNFAFRT